jgi:hypothetical protein
VTRHRLRIWCWSRKKTKDASGKPQIRVATDFRAINNRLLAPGLPLPDLETVIQNLRDCEFFHLIDIANAFLSIELDTQSSPLPSFITRQGEFFWRRLPAGIKSAPACFARLVSLVLGNLQFQSVFWFIDDWSVACKDFASGLTLLREMFERVRSANIRLRPQK